MKVTNNTTQLINAKILYRNPLLYCGQLARDNLVVQSFAFVLSKLDEMIVVEQTLGFPLKFFLFMFAGRKKKVEGALLDLRQFLAIESPLKIMKNAF